MISSKQGLTGPGIPRRRFVLGAGAAIAGACLPLRAGQPAGKRVQPETMTGDEFELNIGQQAVNFTGRSRFATTVNQSLPAPVLRWREGDRVRLRVTNHLPHDSSIHWHGMILPTQMDGVPGLSFDGIKPGESFLYEFDVRQSGTYWYHSHSGFQEQTGLYGAIVIEPREAEAFSYDRDHVVVLSDWSDVAPDRIYAKLKKLSHYYNFRERTLGDMATDVKQKGFLQSWRDRAMWNRMRMSETDIADVNGYTYTFLMNGNTPDRGWFGAYRPGEKIRLRFINAAAMTLFDVRIPGLKMTVVAADGQNVKPVTVDEFRIGVAETYDVIVEPEHGQAYTLFAQSMDRTGYARGVLATEETANPEVPAMDEAPVLTHGDMGMAHDGHDMSSMQSAGDGADPHQGHVMDNSSEPAQVDHSQHQMPEMDHAEHNMGSMQHADHGAEENAMAMDHSQHAMGGAENSLGLAGYGSQNEIRHQKSEFGPQVDMRAEMPRSGLHDPGIGLREHQSRLGRRVLTYADLRNLTPTQDRRQPEREIQLHLTGNMNRYMWSLNGVKFSHAAPLALTYGERVRIVLVNDTMMTHPIHLHGMWSELETGDPDFIPRKHTVIVQPGAKVSYLVTADAKGRWAYHCHLLYHMPGMMREVRVS